MIQVRAAPMSQAGEFPDDPELVLRTMAFHDERAKAGALIDGYTLTQLRDRDEALARSRRFPSPFPGIDRATEARPPFGDVPDETPEEAERRPRGGIITWISRSCRAGTCRSS